MSWERTYFIQLTGSQNAITVLQPHLDKEYDSLSGVRITARAIELLFDDVLDVEVLSKKIRVEQRPVEVM